MSLRFIRAVSTFKIMIDLLHIDYIYYLGFCFRRTDKKHIGGKSQVANVVNVKQFNHDFECADSSDELQGLTTYFSQKMVGCRSLSWVYRSETGTPLPRQAYSKTLV